MSYRKDRQAVKEGKILKERRQELGFTQLEVASECGVELQQYQRLEYGQRRFTTCRMNLGLRICMVLELDPYDLLFLEGQ